MKMQHWARLGIYLGFAIMLGYAMQLMAAHWVEGGAMPALTVFGFSVPGRVFVERIFPLMAIVAAVVCEFCLDPKRGSSFARIFSSRSTFNDLIGAVIAIVPFLLFALAALMTLGLSAILTQMIVSTIPQNLNVFQLAVSHLGLPVTIVLFVLVMTFFDYWRHRLLHTDILFPLHRFHHSATEMTGFTAYRSHPAEHFLQPLFFLLPISLLGTPPAFLVAYTSMVLFHGLIVHGDKGVNWGWFGQYVLCDPLNHRIHHSSHTAHFNKNLCAITPIWDRVFGTYCYDLGEFDLGVDAKESYRNSNFFAAVIEDTVDFVRNFVKKLDT